MLSVKWIFTTVTMTGSASERLLSDARRKEQIPLEVSKSAMWSDFSRGNHSDGKKNCTNFMIILLTVITPHSPSKLMQWAFVGWQLLTFCCLILVRSHLAESMWHFTGSNN